MGFAVVKIPRALSSRDSLYPLLSPSISIYTYLLYLKKGMYVSNVLGLAVSCKLYWFFFFFGLEPFKIHLQNVPLPLCPVPPHLGMFFTFIFHLSFFHVKNLIQDSFRANPHVNLKLDNVLILN